MGLTERMRERERERGKGGGGGGGGKKATKKIVRHEGFKVNIQREI